MDEEKVFKTSYMILKQSSLIVETFDGVMTLKSLLMYKKNLHADPDFDPHFDLLTDISNVEYDMPDLDKLRFLAKTKGEGIFSKGKNVSLISTPEHVFHNEGFRKISPLLSIKHFYSKNLDEVLDYLDHKELRTVVSRFLLEKRNNKDFEWHINPKDKVNFFAKICTSIKSLLNSEKESDNASNIFNVSYKIYPNHNLIIESYSGLITIDDLDKHAKRLSADVSCIEGYNHLIDVRRATYKMSLDELSIFADRMRNAGFDLNKKFAVWASTENQLNFNTMFAHMFKDFSLVNRVSKNLDELLDFLNKKELKSDIEGFFQTNY